MLQAESRARQGVELSDTDRKLTALLHERLFGRGKLMVVGYHPEVGFYLTPLTDDDEDIIRTGPTEFKDSIEQAVWRSGGMTEPERLTLIAAIRKHRHGAQGARAKTG
jgi:hypothetical protein